ncbi:hypothetical protein KEJ44_05065 [Candidatus Bathyarchaeota archaeon]|nr:hypothetical protein [Candidatus Bathyarchaeota archaeon]
MRRNILLWLLVFLTLSIPSTIGHPSTDPRGDLLDRNGNPTTGEPYLDIIEISLVIDGDNYVGTITLGGDVPSKAAEPSIFIEWDFMIDADKNPKTSSWGKVPLLINDIGVDYMVRLCLLENDRWGQIYNGPKNSFQGIDYEVDENMIKLTFSPEDVGGSTNFNFVVLVRKYGNKGAPDALQMFDKAPDEGHYSLEAGSVTYIRTTTGLTSLPTLSMEFNHATVYYSQGNEKRAKDIGEAFEYAYAFLQQDFPQAPSQRFTIYVYNTQEDLVQGLIKFSGFPPSSAEFFKRGGAPRPLNYIMHVSPSFNWHTVAHELTHTFIEEYSGRAYLDIKWLDEGLAEYEAWRCVSNEPRHRQEEEVFKHTAWNTIKSRVKLYPLEELATEEQWVKEMKAGHSNYIYSQSFLIVSYLVSHYGLDEVKEILRKVQEGATASAAVETVLGKTETEILNEFTKASESEVFRAPKQSPSPCKRPLSVFQKLMR